MVQTRVAVTGICNIGSTSTSIGSIGRVGCLFGIGTRRPRWIPQLGEFFYV